MTAQTTQNATQELNNRRAVRNWLYFTSFVLLCLVVVGGATRLTDSGLSITQWKPIHGVIPPLSLAEWQEEFELYQRIPEYQLQNKGMSLEEFKFIFWWEWGHRLLARSLGLIFALPLAYFWIRKKIDPRIKPQLLGLLALGGLQGFIGWWMVSSGLSERVDVSHYRLATHLSMAALILGLMIWVARSIAPHDHDLKPTRHSNRYAAFIVVLVFIQIALGALVAGMDAGIGYNQWPLMGDGLWPKGEWVEARGLANWVETGPIVQFVHRMGAYVLFAVVLIHAIYSSRYAGGSTHSRRAWILFALIVGQVVIGITTLLTYVQLHAALAHQALAFIVLGFAVAHWRGMNGPLPLQDGRLHSHNAR